MRIIKEISAGKQKSQSVVEMMTTYSWAVLIVSLFVAVVFVLSGSPSGQPSLPATCTIQPLLPCQDTILTNVTSSGIYYYVTFTNNLQNPMQFTSNGFNVITTGIGVPNQQYSLGNCFPAFALVGDQILCKAKISGAVEPPTGTQVNILFTMSYNLCLNNQQSSCSSSVYQTSGFATQGVAPANIVFYYLLFTANDVAYNGVKLGANTLLYINGVPYANNANILLVNTGNYNLLGHPPGNYNFTNWAISSASSTLSNSITYNTVLTIKSNVIITATTSNVACGVCYIGTMTSSVCPTACKTVTGWSSATCTAAGSSYSTC